MKGTEYVLSSKLPNTHACLSAVQDFCPNPLSVWQFLKKVATNKVVVSNMGLTSVQKNLTDRKQSHDVIK